MISAGLRRAILLGAILLMLFLSITVVFHRDMDLVYNPSCPACQLANNPVSDIGAVSVAALIPPPIIQYFEQDSWEKLIPQTCPILAFVPRSPPSDICS
jgi:hypothetical protein